VKQVIPASFSQGGPDEGFDKRNAGAGIYTAA